jgi:hypothetical protein
MAFQPKITKARIVYSPFSSSEMVSIGTDLAGSIRDRISSGLNAQDQASKPLKGAKGKYVPYARQKQQKGLAPIRDWKYSGNTLRALKVVAANENSVKIGFSNPIQDRVAHFNNLREKAFGVSPNDRLAINKGIKKVLTEHPMFQMKRVA